MTKGFTLIELLVVVLIIGILSAVALPQYRASVDKARLSRWLPLGKNLKQGVDLYYMANGVFPAKNDFSALDMQLPGSAVFAGGGEFTSSAYFNMNAGTSSATVSGERVRVDMLAEGYIQMQVDFTDNHEMWLSFYSDHYSDIRRGKIFCSGKGDGVKRCERLAGTAEKLSDGWYEIRG